jgi:hypothetical protein
MPCYTNVTLVKSRHSAARGKKATCQEKLSAITLLYDTLMQMRAESKGNADASRRHIPISRTHFKKLFPVSNPTSERADLSDDALFANPLCNNSLYNTFSSFCGFSEAETAMSIRKAICTPAVNKRDHSRGYIINGVIKHIMMQRNQMPEKDNAILLLSGTSWFEHCIFS